MVWSPHLKQDIDRIEKVQRTFTKRLPNLRHFSYNYRFSVLDLPTLELILFSFFLSSLHVHLIWCYKIVFNLVCLNFDDFFEYYPVSIVRGHPYRLYKKRCNSNVRKTIFPTESLMRGILCHLLLILVPYIVLSAL